MKTISITGLDGCGKSTQAELLAKKLPNSRIVSVWDIIKRPEFQSWTIYQQPPDVENYVMHLHPVSRTLFIFHTFNEAYQKAVNSDADYLIFDGNWYKYWAIEKAMGSAKELGDFFKRLYPEPDISIYLKLDIDEIVRRKNNISVYEGGLSDDKTQKFKAIQSQAMKILENLLPEKTFVIDAKNNIENIHQNIMHHIENQFNEN